ncbi:MAG: T9SS type A sorting domain-containing protein [Saprospiraceae bacterium]|nr:MAG: T9SS type A sorting domain-containing protein [Saprospiraceae bacterium]
MIPELCNTCPELCMKCPESCIAPHKKRTDICSISFSINLNAMIRRFTLLLSVFMTTFDVHGQYEPMAVEGAHWVVFDKVADSIYHHLLKIEGDTTVNGEMYKKVYRLEIQSNAALPQDFLPPYYYNGAPQLVGLIRDGVPSEIVYGVFFTTPFSECSIGEEELVHDFSLTAGSYLPGCLHQEQGVSFAEIDSIKNEFVWGKQREVQFVSTGYRFIEGVGGNAGPFSSSSYTVPGVVAEVVDYCIGTDSDCGLEPVGTIEALTSIHSIYPNPAGKSINIEFGNGYKGNIQIRLTDVSGRIFNEITIGPAPASTVSVPLDEVHSGIYFLNIQSVKLSTNHRIVVR